MNPNNTRHQNMIPAIVGHGGMTGQMISRKAWQHETNVAIANLLLLQSAGLPPQRQRGFGHIVLIARRFTAAVGSALVRFGGRLQGGTSAPIPTGEPVASAAEPIHGGGQTGAARSNRRFPMYMHTTPPVRAHSAV